MSLFLQIQIGNLVSPQDAILTLEHLMLPTKKIDRNSSLSIRYRGILSSKEKNEPPIRERQEFDLIPHKKR